MFQDTIIEDLDSAWNAFETGVAWAVDILEQEGVFDSQRLPTTTVLPVLAALHGHLPRGLDALGNARTYIRSYLWRSFATARYDTSSATRALEDFRGLRQLVSGSGSRESVPIFDETQYPIPNVEEIMHASWPKRRDILGRALLAVSLKAGAVDIADGTKATRDNIKKREYHHLFPDALLTGDGGLSEAESSSAVNAC